MRLSTFGLVIFSALGSSRALAPVSVTWSECPPITGIECATVQVPLDWADESKGMIPIALARVAATTPQREGYMFFNPGGPGGSGVEFIQYSGQEIQAHFGAGWDIISWDPRGVGGSGPNITFFSGESDYDAFWNPLFGGGHVGAHGNLTQQSDVDLLMTQVSTYDGVAQSLNQRMIERNGESLKYVGTCAVVRDLVYLVDSLYGQGTDVNFWGISYGTVIAGYLTQMFPDRVGRVILDGVLDPEKYGNNIPMKWMETDIYDIDFALKSWTEACAGSNKCALSTRNDTSSSLLTKIDTILNTAYERYDGSIPVFNLSGIFTWPYDTATYAIQSSMYSTMASDDIGPLLAAIGQHQSNSNSTLLSGKVEPAYMTLPMGRSPYSVMPIYDTIPPDALSNIAFAVFCGDAIDDGSTTTEDAFKETVRISQSVSRIFGSLFPINSLRPMCHKWTPRAVERLPQKFNKQPKNVVLVMSTMGDPITPYYSARRLASSNMLGSKARLVRLNSIGHSTFSNNSTCIVDVVKKFIAGMPPDDAGNDEADVTCNIERTIFGAVPSTWQQFQFNQTHDEPNTSSNSPSSAARFGMGYGLFFGFVSASLWLLG
ncbi:hypothetical protein FRC19_004519 [Serendipita sp. 401]|nr:hypothetical protein FRC16_001035 [Serendipita sp. 398]KAG8810498.1 hypothetical protein FRC19_004519 [Serendipita sp. 401]